eukprot:3807208-Pyramimonas_sp.AAC.1
MHIRSNATKNTSHRGRVKSGGSADRASKKYVRQRLLGIISELSSVSYLKQVRHLGWHGNRGRVSAAAAEKRH